MTKRQIFCFTYAGGKSSFFDTIEKDLPAFDFVKLEYAGHGLRYKEPFYQSFDELSADLFELFKKRYAGGEYALFGYSMGTIAAVEVLKRIVDDSGVKDPIHVYLAAHEPHSKAELVGFSETELDEWVKERTIKFGAVPEELIENRSFWRVYLPLYRADYSIIGKYLFEELKLRTVIPATIFYSETDTPLSEIRKWERYFTGSFECHCYEGTHFFMRTHHKEMAEVIEKTMREK